MGRVGLTNQPTFGVYSDPTDVHAEEPQPPPSAVKPAASVHASSGALAAVKRIKEIGEENCW